MRKKYKKYRLPLMLFILSMLCYGTFYIIGSEVDENGYLNEPFFLLPIGALFFFASFMSLAWIKIKK